MLIEILLLNPIYVTIFWTIVLSFHSKKSHQPKVFLGKFMLVASIVYLSHFFYFTRNHQVYFYLDSLYTLAYLLVYPLYHIYVRLLTVDSELSIRKHLRFLAAPLIIFFLTLLGYLVMGKEQGMNYITEVQFGAKEPIGFQKHMFVLLILGRVTFLLQTIIYVIISFRLIRKNNLRLKDYYSNTEERQLNWVQFFNICFALTSLSSVVLAALGRSFFLESPIMLVFPSLVFSVMLFFIGLLGNNQRAIFTEVSNTPELTEEGKPPQKLKAKLESLFEKEKIYKNPDLKIWDVSSMLGTNRTYVSKIINSEYDRNFCAHVNHYRVEHAKTLIANNPNLTNEQIAQLSGFGSVNSLYRAFHSEEEISLGNFRKQVDKS